jgi:hypothetical protein
VRVGTCVLVLLGARVEVLVDVAVFVGVALGREVDAPVVGAVVGVAVGGTVVLVAVGGTPVRVAVGGTVPSARAACGIRRAARKAVRRIGSRARITAHSSF